VYFWLNNTYFGLFQGQFNIHTPKGEELCFRAAGKVDCDGWAHAVGAVIRSLTVSNQVKINCDGWGGAFSWCYNQVTDCIQSGKN
jgi:hypothetical protein